MQKRTLLFVVSGAIPLAIAMGCAFKSGVTTEPDGGSSSKSFGPQGKDERFEWNETEVTDHQLQIVWERHANRTATWQEASTFCVAQHGRLPTREELLDVSDLFGTSDLFDGPENVGGERAVGWRWSQTPGTRPSTAWAVGGSSYANANDIQVVAMVVCVRAL